MKKEVEERTEIDREIKITLLSVLRKGYFEQKDIDLLKKKVKPLENQTTTIYFRNYGKENQTEIIKKDIINEKEFPTDEIPVNKEDEQENDDEYF